LSFEFPITGLFDASFILAEPLVFNRLIFIRASIIRLDIQVFLICKTSLIFSAVDCPSNRRRSLKPVKSFKTGFYPKLLSILEASNPDGLLELEAFKGFKADASSKVLYSSEIQYRIFFRLAK
jgi:hypothetical protein